MKIFNLIWKIALIILAISFTALVAIIGWKVRDDNKGYTWTESLSSDVEAVYHSKSHKLRVRNVETGKFTTPKFDWVSSANKHDTTVVFKYKGKRGYLDRFTGEITIPARYDKAWKFSEGLGGVVKDGKLGFINSTGEVLIDFNFTYNRDWTQRVDFLFKGGFCTAIDSLGRQGLIDKRGKWVLSPEYEYINNPVMGYRIVCDNNRYGVLDSTLNWVCVVENDWIEICEDGFMVTCGGTRKLLAFDGSTVIYPFMYDNVYSLPYNSWVLDEHGEYMQLKSDYMAYTIGSKYGLMDKNGKVISKAIYNDIDAISNHIFKCQIGDEWITVNAKGEVIY